MPVQGRWLSPDPAGLSAADPSSPQSWNRYAYVMNNPLAFTDPAGLCGGQLTIFYDAAIENGQITNITITGTKYTEFYPGSCAAPCRVDFSLGTIHCGMTLYMPDVVSGQSGNAAPNLPVVKRPTPPKKKGYGVFLSCQLENVLGHIGDADFVKTAIVLHAGTAVATLTGRVKLAGAGFVALTLFDLGTAAKDNKKCSQEAYGNGTPAGEGPPED